MKVNCTFDGARETFRGRALASRRGQQQETRVPTHARSR